MVFDQEFFNQKKEIYSEPYAKKLPGESEDAPFPCIWSGIKGVFQRFEGSVWGEFTGETGVVVTVSVDDLSKL